MAPIGKLPHFFLDQSAKPEKYQRPPGPPIQPKEIPPQDREIHGVSLSSQLSIAIQQAKQKFQEKGVSLESSMCLDFEGFPDVPLKTDSLGNRNAKIELLNVRKENNVTKATVLIPKKKESHFEKKIDQYLHKDVVTVKEGKEETNPKNRLLVDSTSSITCSEFKSLWTDKKPFPADLQKKVWWEVWLRKNSFNTFKAESSKCDVHVSDKELFFPERDVCLAYASPKELENLQYKTNSCIAELRFPETTPRFFTSMSPKEQMDWIQDLESRVNHAEPLSPAVCILDTGVKNKHPLLNPSLADSDMHSYHPHWDKQDDDGHLFDSDPTDSFENMLLTGETTDLKKEFQFFETPPELARKMIEMAELKDTDRVLEPSAGKGAIAKEIKTGYLCCNELNTKMAAVLMEELSCTVSCAYFHALGTKYDKIIMNPPFTKQQDVDHILHAYSLLKSGGILVSVVSESPFFRENKKSVEFRGFLDNVNAEIITNPEGTFKSSGTMVRTRIVKIIK